MNRLTEKILDQIEKSINSKRCVECNAPANWERKTQFAGDHPYCDKHARLENDFGQEDSYTYWQMIK